MVHPMYLVFLVSVGVFFWAVAACSMLGVIAAYVSAGVALRTYEQQKPILERPMLDIPFLLGVFTWPFRVPLLVYEYFWRLRNPHRFVVSGAGDRKTATAASWDQAISLARKIATESGQTILIIDTGRLRKSRLRHDVYYVIYQVSPSGDIKKAPY